MIQARPPAVFKRSKRKVPDQLISTVGHFIESFRFKDASHSKLPLLIVESVEECRRSPSCFSYVLIEFFLNIA